MKIWLVDHDGEGVERGARKEMPGGDRADGLVVGLDEGHVRRQRALCGGRMVGDDRRDAEREKSVERVRGRDGDDAVRPPPSRAGAQKFVWGVQYLRAPPLPRVDVLQHAGKMVPP